MRELKPIKVEPVEKETAQLEKKVVSRVAAASWTEETQLPMDWWELQYLGGTRIGYFHTAISQDKGMVRIHRRGVLSVGAKNSAPKLFVVETTADELVGGELYQFEENNTLGGEQVSSVVGIRDGDKLKLDFVTRCGVEQVNPILRLEAWHLGNSWAAVDAHAQPDQARRAANL